MNGGETNIVLCEVARDIIAEIAPHELPLFPAVSSAYLANPAAALKRPRGAEAALGFGTEFVPAILTTIVLYVLSEVLKTLAEAARKAVADSLAKEATAARSAMFKRFHEPGQPAIAPILGEAQLATVRERIVRAGHD